MVNSTNLMVGLTGGMGCGKSTAAARFAERGFRRLDADQVVRDELLPSPEVAAAIRDRLGPAMLAADGTVRRDRVAEDRKSTRLNSSHQIISYAVFFLKKKKI